MAALGEAEEILLYYSGDSALDPPRLSLSGPWHADGRLLRLWVQNR